MDERDVFVLCRWNGRIKKHGPNGIHYQGSTSRAIRVKRNTELIRLLDRLYLITGFDKRRSELRVTGRYPSAAGQSLKYVGLPLTNDRRLKIMLEAPMIHPCMIHVELYLQANRGGCFTHKKDLRVSSLWLDDREFRVGLRFKDEAEIKKAVDWLSIREERYCRAQETGKDMCAFECLSCNCEWSVCAKRMGECFEITKYTGPHTCCPDDTDESGSDTDESRSGFEECEIKRVVRLHPTALPAGSTASTSSLTASN